MDHPYYDSDKKKKQEQYFFRIFPVLLFIVFIMIFGLAMRKVITWEDANMIEVWVDYEAIVDQDKVILYKSHNPQDSMVFRIPCTNNPFKGVKCIEKLEYRLP